MTHIPDSIFVNCDDLDLYFSTDGDQHQSVQTIVSKLSKCENLHTLWITLWINTVIGKLF